MPDARPAPDANAPGPTETTSIPKGPRVRIGPYDVVSELASGGMGTVFLAVRADAVYHKRVAIKVTRVGIDSEEVAQSFRREQRILASLNHPNIAKLLDGGKLDDGSPYIVMEYIEGQPIDVYCDRHGLSVAERIRLFRRVCDAVQYAHRNLVVHRDLKPLNILVTADGDVKLLDFGIAKILNPELLGDGVTGGRMAFTPQYASPEQARGEVITTATDTYSLGVILYELLTGRRPYRTTSRQVLDVLRAVTEESPEPPSAAVFRVASVGGNAVTPEPTPEAVSRSREETPDRLRRKLRGDLDTILLNALRKEPQKRYGSVEALSEDLARYLDGRPILAVKATLSYRTRKFVQRHVLAVAVSGAIALLMCGLVAKIVVQSTQLRRALAGAEKEKERAERVSEFLVNLFKVSDPRDGRGATITAREVLDKGTEHIATALRDQPEVRATLLRTIGTVYGNLGLYDKALPVLREALKLRRESLGNSHPDVAASLSDLSRLLRNKGDFSAAATAEEESLVIRRKALGNENLDVASSLVALSYLLLFGPNAEHARAESLSREGLAILRRLLPPEDPRIADAADGLGSVLHEKGDLISAEAMYREALGIRRQMPSPDDALVSVSLNNVAMTTYDRGDLPGAESLFRESLALKQKRYGPDHPIVGTGLHNLGNTLNEEGKGAEALPMLRQSLAIQRKALGDDNPRVATTLSALADALTGVGQLGEAEALYRQAVAVLERRFPADHRMRLDSEMHLGIVLTKEGRAHEAEPLLRGVLDRRRKTLPAGDVALAQAASALGGCMVALKQYREAEDLLVGSYETLLAKRGAQNVSTRDALQRLISLYAAVGQAAKLNEYRAQVIATP